MVVTVGQIYPSARHTHEIFLYYCIEIITQYKVRGADVTVV